MINNNIKFENTAISSLHATTNPINKCFKYTTLQILNKKRKKKSINYLQALTSSSTTKQQIPS